MYGAVRKQQQNIYKMLEQRERKGPSPKLDMQFLRWAAGEWLDKPIRSSSYFQLNPEARSTIALAFSTDGVLFASTHGDHTVKVFTCATWSLLCTLCGHRRTPWTIKFHPRDRNLIASGSLDETVRIWDLRTETCIRTLEFDFVVSCIAFHSSGELLAVTSGRRIFLCRWNENDRPSPTAVVNAPPGANWVDPLLPSASANLLNTIGSPPGAPPAIAPIVAAFPTPPQQQQQQQPGLLGRLAARAGAVMGGSPASFGSQAPAGAGGGGSNSSDGGGGLTADRPQQPPQQQQQQQQQPAPLPSAPDASTDPTALLPAVETPGAGGGASGSGGDLKSKVVILSGENPQRCVAFKRSASHELFFVAETNPETPPDPPPQPNLYQPHQAPPFTVQLFMWTFPLDHPLEGLMRTRLDTSKAALKVSRSVMYSDAGFDVSKCGRYLALCELDPSIGYHLRIFSLQRRSMGQPLQTVALPNCPFVTSVQFAPLSYTLLIGYGRCQAPSIDQAPAYAVLRCIAFSPRPGGAERQLTEEVEVFSVDSTDESNVALFHPHPHACAQLGFLYATKDGRIRAFRFDRDGTSTSFPPRSRASRASLGGGGM